VTLDLTINNAVSGTDQVVACDTYTWIDGNTYSSSTTSPQVTLTAANGCDSIVSLNLTINNAVNGTDQVVACDTYTWIDGNTYLASTASPQVTLTAANGCDSVVTLDLTINNAVTGTDQVVACDNYTWINGITYTASTSTPQVTFTAANGCDSIVTLDLTINNAVSGTDQVVACGSYTWIDGVTYTSSNNSATQTLTAVNGCDSIVTLDLTINNAVTGTDQVVACDTYTWIDGNTYAASTSSPQVTLTAANGCDSIVSLDLTINNSSTGQVSVNGCNQIEVNGQVYIVSGTYVQYLTNNDGCDSVLTINTSVTYSNFIQTQPNNTSVAEGQDAQFFILGPPSAQYQWQTNLGLGYQNLNDFGQYSGTTTQALQVSGTTIGTNNNQAFRCLVTEGNCTDTSVIVLLSVTPNTSVAEYESSIQLFPNPTTGSVTVVLSRPIGEIEIYNLQGKLLFQKEIAEKQTQLDLSNYANGVYLIRIEQEGQFTNQKVILQR